MIHCKVVATISTFMDNVRVTSKFFQTLTFSIFLTKKKKLKKKEINEINRLYKN